MDYDKSVIAAIYDEARVITSERLRQWQEVLSTQLDRTAISVVVDLGCGTGRFTESLATHFGAQVIGIDPSLKMIGKALKKSITGNVLYRPELTLTRQGSCIESASSSRCCGLGRGSPQCLLW